MIPTTGTDPSGDVRAYAFAKVSKVLGPDRARQVMDRLLAELDIELRTPHDLLRLSEGMSRLGGFEGAVGAMLGVTAVLWGATPVEERPDHLAG